MYFHVWDTLNASVGFRLSAEELVEAPLFHPAHQQGDLRRRHRRELRSPCPPGIYSKRIKCGVSGSGLCCKGVVVLGTVMLLSP